MTNNANHPDIAGRGLTMAPEWTEHEATWMIYPPAAYPGTQLEAARHAWAEVARAVARFEPVRMVARAEDLDAARAELGDTVEFVVADVDDAWARDVAPTFVKDSSGSLVAIDWIFNGWGEQPWATWERDDKLASVIARELGVESYRSSIVNEGGGIEVDGTGLVVLTETVQQHPQRNGLGSNKAIEAELRETIGADRFIWLLRGLTGDYQDYSTSGHVDLCAKFIGPNLALYHDQRNVEHYDLIMSGEFKESLESAGVETIALPAPATIELGPRVCDWSYVNCYFVNGGLIVGVFDDPADEEALSVLRSAVPDREIVTVDARVLFALGGGVHCVTQQQPR